jgi:multicomponent Na+:H+ antiporter subunit G
MDILEIIVYVLLTIGIFVNSMSILGLMRFPDVYTRLHAATKTTTFGCIFIVGGIVVMNIAQYEDTSLIIILHSLAALFVVIFTNPISAHAIARAAMLSGIKPYGAKVDQFSERFKKTGDAPAQIKQDKPE